MASAYAVTGISGNVTQSPSGSYTGDWFIETQWLEIDYCRVIHSMVPLSDQITALSGTFTRNHSIGSTSLNVLVRAKTDSYIEIGTTYDTSTDLVLQQLAHTPSLTDASGTSYGALGAGILGPAGTIVTTRDYYRRVPYTGQTAIGIRQIWNATNAVYVSYGGFGFIQGLINSNNASLPRFFQSNRYGVPPGKAHSYYRLDAITGAKFHYCPPILELPGPYSTSQEDSEFFKSLLTELSHYIRYGNNLCTPQPFVGLDPTISPGIQLYGVYGSTPLINPNSTAPFYLSLPTYDPSRHSI